MISCVVLFALLSGCNKPQPAPPVAKQPAPTYKTHVTDAQQIDAYIDWKAHLAQVERYKKIGDAANLAAIQNSCRYYAHLYNTLKNNSTGIYCTPPATAAC